MGGTVDLALDEAAIMAVLETVPDPEIPVLTITDLGIVRGIASDPPRVLISPTYTGCPATVAIETMIREALDSAGYHDVGIERALFPPWTTEWISERGLQRLHAYGIAPPSPSAKRSRVSSAGRCRTAVASSPSTSATSATICEG